MKTRPTTDLRVNLSQEALAQGARGVRLMNQAVCRKCEQPMETVATIEPVCKEPGLIACGGTNSVRVYPERGEDHDHAERRRVSDHAKR